jgi:putative DNA primase/helicase
MPKPGSKLPLCDTDLANLRASGLTDATIWANQLRTEYDCATLAAILHRAEDAACCRGGLVFPYRNLAGEVNCFARVRPHFPRLCDGSPVKYEQPVGESSRAYFPVASLAKIRDGQSSVCITEGEKKALALAQLDIAAVGLGGVWCWKKRGTDELIDDLASVPWHGRVAYIVYDYDPKPTTRRQVALAARRLARALRGAGVKEVYIVELPPGPDGAKQGADDFLVANGDDALRQLIERAPVAPDLAKVFPLTKAEGRTDAANAARLGAKHGEAIRWVGPWDKWLIWDGTHWKLDQVLAIDLKAKEVAGALFEEITAELRGK